MNFSLPFLNLDTVHLDRKDSPLETVEETSDIDATYAKTRSMERMFDGTFIPAMISTYAADIRQDHSITTPVRNWIVIDGANVFFRNPNTGQLGNSFDKFLGPEYNYLRGTSQIVVVISREAYETSFAGHMEQNFTDFLNIFSEVVTISPPGVRPVQTVRAPVVIGQISLLACRNAKPGVPCLRRHGEQKNPSTGKMEKVCSIVTYNMPKRPESSRTTPYSRPQNNEPESSETEREHKWCEFDDIVAVATRMYLRDTRSGTNQILFTHERNLEDEASGSKSMQIIDKLREMGPQATVKLIALFQR